jgi:Glycosyltransferase family 87
MSSTASSVRAGPVLLATVLTLSVGFLVKAPCLGPWSDGRQYNRLCYSDVAALYASDDRDRGLDQNRIPYVDGQNEYPVLTGLAMWVAALPANSYPGFFVWTTVLLTGVALVTAWALTRIAGRWAFLFALAPTLAIYGLVNWDLIAVMLATVATLAYLRRRDGAAGVLLGLGAAAKLYPGLLVAPFALGRLREGRGPDAARVAGAAALSWAAINLPPALASPERWSEFFRFNSSRGADWDSLWYLLERNFGFTWDTAALNVLSAASFVVLSVVLWRAASSRRPEFPAWTFGFPLLVAFLLTSKVYSPQYGLWLLPWFAAALPDLRLFALFEAADVAVFVTRFQFFARFEGVGEGLPFGAFEVALLARAAVLVACLVAWVVRSQPAREPAPALEAA